MSTTLNDYKEEIHPWKPYVPPNANKLILGTFPTSESNRGAFEFFYPNPNNDFWPIIFKIAGRTLTEFSNEDPVAARKSVLDVLKMGIADMARRVLRQNGSSKDDNLFPIEYTDILAILDANSSIKEVIVTSSSGGNSVMSWLYHYCRINGISFRIPKDRLPTQTSFTFQEREITVVAISSTSRLSPIKGDNLYEMYRKAISKN